MTPRRIRRRVPQVVSALEGADPFDNPKRILNDATPGVTRCAWPDCRSAMQYEQRIPDAPIVQTRYGVLCHTHAVDVAIAVIQQQADHNRTAQFFSRMSTERAIRLEQWRREDEKYEAEKAALRKERDGFVYYIHIGERIKIGYSVDVKRRMRAYPPGSKLLAVEPGDRDLERKRHQQFAGSRTEGREWFQPTVDIMELVQELVDVYGEPKRFAHHYRRNQSPTRVKPDPGSARRIA